MNAEFVKKCLAFASTNKEDLHALLAQLNPAEPHTGKLSLTEPLVNQAILTFLNLDDPESTLPVEEVCLQFRDDLILVHAKVSMEKKISFLSLSPMVTIKLRLLQVHFNAQTHKIIFSVENGLPLRSAMIAAMSRMDLFAVQNDRITMDLDRTPAAEKIPPWLSLAFLSCENGRLELAYEIK